MKYLSLSKRKKKKQIPQMLGHGPFFHVIYRNLSKTGWGIGSEKGKIFQTACFQKPSEPCWSRWTDILLESQWNHLRAHAISQERADLEFCCLSPISSQPGCSTRDQRVIPGLCSFPGVGSVLCSNSDSLDHSPQCQKEKEAAHCLSPILP